MKLILVKVFKVKVCSSFLVDIPCVLMTPVEKSGGRSRCCLWTINSQNFVNTIPLHTIVCQEQYSSNLTLRNYKKRWNIFPQLDYKHYFECLLALCCINPFLDFETIPQMSHGEATLDVIGLGMIISIDNQLLPFQCGCSRCASRWRPYFLPFHRLCKP